MLKALNDTIAINTNDTIMLLNEVYYSIISRKDFYIKGHKIKKGERGGYISGDTHIKDNSWVDYNSLIYHGIISDHSYIESSVIFDCVIKQSVIESSIINSKHSHFINSIIKNAIIITSYSSIHDSYLTGNEDVNTSYQHFSKNIRVQSMEEAPKHDCSDTIYEDLMHNFQRIIKKLLKDNDFDKITKSIKKRNPKSRVLYIRNIRVYNKTLCSFHKYDVHICNHRSILYLTGPDGAYIIFYRLSKRKIGVMFGGEPFLFKDFKNMVKNYPGYKEICTLAKRHFKGVE